VQPARRRRDQDAELWPRRNQDLRARAMRRLVISIVATAMLVGCGSTYDVVAPNGEKLATCHDGALQSFCQVASPPGTTVMPGTPVVPGITQILMGAGIATMGGALAAAALK
jgi:hypothetical protein